MVNAEDADRVWSGLDIAGLKEEVRWSGRFSGTQGGVAVLDLTNVAEVRERLEAVGANIGSYAIDGWWSTRAVGMLPREAGRLRFHIK